MQKHRPIRPMLETLEDRTVPATIRFVNGSLFISQQRAALTIAPQGGTDVKVTDGTLVTTFSGVGNIHVTGTNKADTVNVDSSVGGFNSNFFFNLGNGTDTLNVTGANPLLGNFHIQTGLGNDTVNLGTAGATTIGGNVFLFDQGGQADSVTLGGGGAKFLSNLTIQGMNNVVFAPVTTIGGRVTVLSNPDTSNLNFNVTSNVTFAGDVYVRSGVGNDTIGVTGNFLGDFSIDLGGATTANTVFLAGTNVNGDLSVRGGSGSDQLINPATNVDGDLRIDFGDGANTINFGGTVAGDLLVSVGNGDNTFGPYAADVAGDVRFRLGNGNNTLTFTSGSIAGALVVEAGNGTNTATLTGTTLAGPLRWRSGNGTNTLNLTPAAASLFNVDVLFGNGNDTFTGNANLTLNGRVDGGTGTDTFVQGGATLTPTLVLGSFEA